MRRDVPFDRLSRAVARGVFVCLPLGVQFVHVSTVKPNLHVRFVVLRNYTGHSGVNAAFPAELFTTRQLPQTPRS